ncbi:MAG: phenylalanine--tRNA ligase subunit beta [Tenericutes bacterium HGW-Tenericutes-3]|nr:MAG: phenylalanine--tRNA ligase subunit beta [Tenericutes bacterium HGW-Tenericutes-3]
MKITQRMLKEWVNIPENILEVTNQKIIEVESFGPLNESTDLVIGHVLTCEDHPNSDHLHVTTVDLGDRVDQIVCGAENVAKGQYVIVAQVGTVLPGDFKIKASKIRGEASNGMICSLKELGLDDKYIPSAFKDGIFHFEKPQKIGTPGLEALALEGWVMELGLTPNRADLLSVLGFAYDLASMTNQKVNQKTFKIIETNAVNPVKIDIETEGCGTYHTRYFESLTIKESPWWLKSALLANDMKPINNVVDISNYVLLEYGTPLHMFDANKVKTNHVLVRNAIEGEKVITLDEQERVLNSKDVVITNTKEVIAIGGVMGLYNTMIDDKTTQVILEAAYFDPKSILQTSKRLNLRSEASLRFERGVDDQRVILGLERATELLIELADAKVAKNVNSKIYQKIENPKVSIPKNYFNEKLGVNITEKQLLEYFDAYNYIYEVNKEGYIVEAPSYRRDLLIKADFLEEIARIYGLDNIPNQTIYNVTKGKLSFKQKRIRGLRHYLADLGLNEIISYSLIAKPDVHRYQNLGESISILMPLSEDKNTLRQSLVHGLLETVKYNQARQQASVAIFEIGNCFAKDIETMHLGIALSGNWHKNAWKKQEFKTDFYVLKGILDSAFSPLGIEFGYVSTNHIEAYHPYRQANITYNGNVIGQIAELHPLETKALGITPTVVLDIDLKPLLVQSAQVLYSPMSRYPNIDRDLAIVVDETVTADELIKMIEQTARKNLVKINVFDVYQGSHIEKGKKSIAFNLVFNDVDKTLESDDVDQLMKKITNRLSFSYKATIRN